MQKDVKPLLIAKKDKLVRIATRKRRHKTEEEKKRFDERYSKAIKYLGELNVIFSLLEEANFMARSINEDSLELLRKRMYFEPLFEGEYVKLYYLDKSQERYLITSSVQDIESFKWSKSH